MIDPERTIHDFEQATAAVLNAAVMLGDYFKKLMAEGFTRDEAFELIVNYQTILFTRVAGRDDS